jgi:hypothetical protein
MERPKNLDKPPIDVNHADLEKYGESKYKAVCPKCGGLLLVGRDRYTFVLEEFDRCLLCGQAYRYTDINELRKLEGLSD